jgi:hypothetical protein
VGRWGAAAPCAGCDPGRANVPLVGASGACYSFLIYAACIAPYARIIFIVVPVPLWVLAALLVCIRRLFSTYVEFAAGFSGGVPHGAHLGGAVVGFLVAFRQGLLVDYRAVRLRARVLRAPDARANGGKRARRLSQRKAAVDRELQLDAILAKVKAQGLSSLVGGGTAVSRAARAPDAGRNSTERRASGRAARWRGAVRWGASSLALGATPTPPADAPRSPIAVLLFALSLVVSASAARAADHQGAVPDRFQQGAVELGDQKHDGLRS